MYMIDDPDPLDPIETWEEFLREILNLDQKLPEVKWSVNQARLVIAEKKAEK